MSRGFGRSGWFGLIGVIVVAALVAVIAATTGQGEANPKLTLALIFGVIAIFVVVLLVLQRSDIERAAGGDAARTNRGAAEGSRRVENPTAMAEPELWGALAVAPIETDAIRARSDCITNAASSPGSTKASTSNATACGTPDAPSKATG